MDLHVREILNAQINTSGWTHEKLAD